MKSGQRIDSNQEFIGQGLANILGSFASGYVSSGSFTRSGVNYSAGAKTPLAPVFSALFLVLTLIALAPLVRFLPIASMAAILLLVAYSLVDVHHIRAVVKTSRAEGAIGRKRTSGANAINISTRNSAENTGASGVFAPAE